MGTETWKEKQKRLSEIDPVGEALKAFAASGGGRDGMEAALEAYGLLRRRRTSAMSLVARKILIAVSRLLTESTVIRAADITWTLD